MLELAKKLDHTPKMRAFCALPNAEWIIKSKEREAIIPPVQKPKPKPKAKKAKKAKPIGKPPSQTFIKNVLPLIKAEFIEMYEKGIPMNEIGNLTGISKTEIHRVKNLLMINGEIKERKQRRRTKSEIKNGILYASDF